MREHRHRVRRKGTCHVDVGGETVVVREVLDGDTEVSIVVSQPPFGSDLAPMTQWAHRS